MRAGPPSMPTAGTEPPPGSPAAVAVAAFDVDYATHHFQPLAVVIAAYNEADAIADVVARIPDMVCGLRTDTIVVVDGSSDDTAAVARAAGALVCDLPVNQGQGAALRVGYHLAGRHGAQFLATLDADGQYDPAELEAVVGPLVADQADFVSGSRRLGAAHTSDATRRAGVVVFARLISLLTGATITDPANGLRAMRVDLATSVTLLQQQYQASELLIGAAMRGWRLTEVPTTMYERSAGTTKKGRNLLYGWRFARVILGTWRRERLGLRTGLSPLASSYGPVRADRSNTTSSQKANFIRKSAP